MNLAKFNQDTRDSIRGKNNYKPFLGSFPSSQYNSRRQSSEDPQPYELLPEPIERDL